MICSEHKFVIIRRVDLLMDLQRNMDLLEKLAILSAAAKYDVACTSSGVDRKGKGTGMGNAIAPGVCHTFLQMEGAFPY